MEIAKLTKENALEIFTGEKLEGFLKEIEDEAMKIVPDIKTDKGRKEIASNAHIVAKKKVEIDVVGKALVTDWKNKARIVDESRKKSRDFLDDLKTRVRQPLTEWEEKESERIESEKLKAEFELAYEEATKENEIYDREKEIERKEMEMRAKEEERLEKERIEKEKQEQLEREKQIAQEAKEEAEKEAAEKIEEVKREKIKVEIKAKEEKEAADRQFTYEKEQAIRIEREAAAKKELDRLEKERVEKERVEKKAANIKHRKKINNEALTSFINEKIPEEQAKKIILLIAEYKIKNITINY